MICNHIIKCADYNRRPCLLDAGHEGGCNPFYYEVRKKKASSITSKENWIPMCPKCGCGHLIVAAKPYEAAIISFMCYECKHLCGIEDVKFKRL